jgi:hypothetical protein
VAAGLIHLVDSIPAGNCVDSEATLTPRQAAHFQVTLLIAMIPTRSFFSTVVYVK